MRSQSLENVLFSLDTVFYFFVCVVCTFLFRFLMFLGYFCYWFSFLETLFFRCWKTSARNKRRTVLPVYPMLTRKPNTHSLDN